jgi:L-seryl-tRNA(Ser) seleniumtransferase
VLVEVARRAIELDRVEHADELARRRARRMLVPVINATGVLLHTNLGRAPLAVETAATYTNLELNLATGKRGSRQANIGELLATACGSEAAMVVNNCAGAVLLTLAALAQGRGVAVGRGEMVEIGGGFRIPDVMNQSGAHLIEVGTTNRSRLSDYVAAANAESRSGPAATSNPVAGLAMVLKVHRSNYKIVGFTEDVSVRELAASPDIAVPVVADIGSGLLDRSCPWLDGPPPGWLADEPAVRQTLADGADLVLFSGDKLFGGPQAGIIAGRRDLVERCGHHPLARALRPGSLVIHALQQVTLAYLDRRGDDIPLWRMVATTTDELKARSESIVAGIEAGADASQPAPLSITATPTEAVPGGGTLPTVTLPSHGLRIDGDITEQLRNRDRPIIARVEDATTVIDLRTVDRIDDAELTAALMSSGGQ